MRYVAQLVPSLRSIRRLHQRNWSKSQRLIFSSVYWSFFWYSVLPWSFTCTVRCNAHSGENWPPRTTLLRFPKVFHFSFKGLFFLTQCHGSPWRGRQCTRHLIRWISSSTLLSVLGITLTKCTSLKYTTTLPSQPWLVDHLVYCWPLYKWRNYYKYESYYSYNREENHLCEHN